MNGEEEKQEEAVEGGEISFPEAFFILLLSLANEVSEWIGDLANFIPVLGQAVWIFTYILGLVISGLIILWSYLRGMYGDKARIKKLMVMLGGSFADLVTLGVFPETVTLAIAIWMHNHPKVEKAATAAAGKVSK